ncbi:MAG: hypothetical protein PHQ32_00525 [Firmicutes bacterium]|nr:hypothetical protein [Bacillota bacterium]
MENENIDDQEIEITEDSIKLKCKKDKNYNNKSMHASGGAVYGFGFIGAVVYFFSTASGFWIGILGLLKAIVWPAILVFELMKYLNL